jgi:hypothetical protein
MDLVWHEQALEQLTWHWDVHVRPRLDGLSDDEYFWEPVANCWSLRARDDARTSMAAGAGDLVIDWEFPEPKPPPVTTIAWRLAHVTVGVFGQRNASHFGGPPMTYGDTEHPPTAAGALAALDAVYATWVDGVRALGVEGMARPVGPAEGPFAEHPYGTLVLHINREAIHHLGEVLLLRDLYRASH